MRTIYEGRYSVGMKRLLLLAPLLLLAGCVEPNEQACNGFSLDEMTKEQIEAVATICAKKPEAPTPVEKVEPQPVEKSLTVELREGAAEVGMPVDAFMHTPAGFYLTSKHYAPLVVGPMMILLIWLIVAGTLRYSVRTPSKIEERKTWRGKRFVATEYKCNELDGWFVGFLLAIGAAYSAAVYFGVMA